MNRSLDLDRKKISWKAFAVATLAAVMTASLCGFIFSSTWGHLTVVISMVSLYVGYLSFRKQLRLWSDDDWLSPVSQKFLPAWNFSKVIIWTLSCVVFWICWRQFTYVYFFSDHTWRILNPNNFGDLPLHLQYIRNLAQGAQMPPVNPNFPSEPLRYPLGIDFFSSMFEVLGWYTPGHLMFLGLLFTFVALVLLGHCGGWFLIGAVFLSGGLFGFEFLVGEQPFAWIVDRSWQNFISALWIPQRGIMMAIPCGVFIFFRIRAYIDDGASLHSGKIRTLGFLLGGLAFFHLHTFALLSLWLAFYFFYHLPDKRVRRVLWRIGIWAILVGAWFVWHSTAGFRAGGVTHLIQHLWMNEHSFGSASFVRSLVFNYGFYLLLPLLLVGQMVYQFFSLRKAQQPKIGFSLRRDLILFFGSWVLFQFVIVAPWEWDNIKVLFWAYLGICVLAWERLFSPLSGNLELAASLDDRRDQRSRFGIWSWFWRLSLVAVLCIAFFGSGFLTMLPQTLRMETSVTLIDQRRLTICEQLLVDIPIDAKFASSTSHNHCLAMLGRIRMIGYPGHLWSHGIEFSKQREALEDLMRGRPNWRQAGLGLAADYIFWGPDESAEFGGDAKDWQAELPIIVEYKDAKIYRLPKP